MLPNERGMPSVIWKIRTALIWKLPLLTGGVYFEASARENHEGVHAAFLHLCQEVGLFVVVVNLLFVNLPVKDGKWWLQICFRLQKAWRHFIERYQDLCTLKPLNFQGFSLPVGKLITGSPKKCKNTTFFVFLEERQKEVYQPTLVGSVYLLFW